MFTVFINTATKKKPIQLLIQLYHVDFFKKVISNKMSFKYIKVLLRCNHSGRASFNLSSHRLGNFAQVIHSNRNKAPYIHNKSVSRQGNEKNVGTYRCKTQGNFLDLQQGNTRTVRESRHAFLVLMVCEFFAQYFILLKRFLTTCNKLRVLLIRSNFFIKYF